MKKNIYQQPTTTVIRTELTLLSGASGNIGDKEGDGRAGAKESFDLWNDGSNDAVGAGGNGSLWED